MCGVNVASTNSVKVKGPRFRSLPDNSRDYSVQLLVCLFFSNCLILLNYFLNLVQCQCHVFATLITFTNPLTDCQQERNMVVFT